MSKGKNRKSPKAKKLRTASAAEGPTPADLLARIKARSANGEYDAIVIGSGFGGSVAITKLVDRGLRVLVLERGAWWDNPEGPGLKKPSTYPFSGVTRQYWPRPNSSLGLTYTLESIYKESGPSPGDLKAGDLGVYENRDGLYRLTRFSDATGKVDIVSASGVGGGSLIYSGVNLIPHQVALSRSGLGHLTGADFRAAGEWMWKSRKGRLSKVNTKAPVPQHIADTPTPDNVTLWTIPGSGEAPPVFREMWNKHFEMPDPDLPPHERDYMLLDRARVLQRGFDRVKKNGGITVSTGAATTTAQIGELRPLPLSVTEYEKWTEAEGGSFSDKNNTFCSREGRCITGCLPSARHTLYKMIQNLVTGDGRDIDVLPKSKVAFISKPSSGGYSVTLTTFVDGDAETLSLNAPRVFVAAGCLGSNEIMLNTRREHSASGGGRGLALSDRVGHGFSTNGDFFGFSSGVPERSDLVPDAERMGKVNPAVGPINTSAVHVTFPAADSVEANRIDLHVEDAGIPTMFSHLVCVLLGDASNWSKLVKLGRALLRAIRNKDPFSIKEDPDPQLANQKAFQTERELTNDLFFFNVMGTGPNEPLGVFSLDKKGKKMRLTFPSGALHDWSVFAHIDKTLEKVACTDGMGGTYVPSPFWTHQKRVTVVHPLGGCGVGSDRSNGVIDHLGRVFDASQANAQAVYPGLYVLDAAAINGALGVNPTYTIVTQALHTMATAQ